MRYGEAAWQAMERRRDPEALGSCPAGTFIPPIIRCQACDSEHPDTPGMCSDSCPSCRTDGRRHCDCEGEK